jgi:putative metallohydrolase (TIGR04338 family)
MASFSDCRIYEKKKRDFQRRRVYDAEKNVELGRRISDIWDIQVYVNSITSMPEFRNRFPRWHHIEVKDGRGCRRALGSTDGWIKMPIWSRNEMIILHEMAHVVSAQFERHGPAYCGNYLWLIHRVMGEKVYFQLRASFLAHGVKFDDPIAYEDPAKKALQVMMAKKLARQAKANTGMVTA